MTDPTAANETEGATQGRLRVLSITNLWPGAADPSFGTFVASQMRSVERLGVSVDVHFINGRASAAAYLTGAVRTFMLNFKRRRYDLVHAHTGHCGLIARLQWRYPILISYVGYDVYGKIKSDGKATVRSRVEGTVFRSLSLVANASITKSSRMEGQLPRSARERNAVLPNGVDRRQFRPIPRYQARRRLGWPSNELTVIFVGRSEWPRKRVEVARAACDIAGRDVGGLRLRICEGLTQDLVVLWMSAADVLLLPSLAEGSPNVVKEALACDLPVVATDVGDVPALIGQVSRCRVLPVEATANDFAVALVELFRGGPVRSDGRKKTSDLSDEVIAERLVRIYESIALGRSAQGEPRIRSDAAV